LATGAKLYKRRYREAGRITTRSKAAAQRAAACLETVVARRPAARFYEPPRVERRVGGTYSVVATLEYWPYAGGWPDDIRKIFKAAASGASLTGTGGFEPILGSRVLVSRSLSCQPRGGGRCRHWEEEA
jgi:hypothetical protein